MSDQQGDTSGASPATDIQIPKYRLDEEVQKRVRLEQELEGMKGLLHRVVQQPQGSGQAPEQEDPELLELKEQNPILYRRMKDQEQKQRQISASLFAQQEEFDRSRFINEAGQAEANRIGAQIEQRLDELRKRGVFTFSRSDLYRYQVGQETLQERRKKPTPAPSVPVDAQGAAQHTPEPDAPSQNPAQSQVPTGGAASKGEKAPSLAELEARLENVEF